MSAAKLPREPLQLRGNGAGQAGGAALRGGSRPSDTLGKYDAFVGGGVRITRPALLRTVV